MKYVLTTYPFRSLPPRVAADLIADFMESIHPVDAAMDPIRLALMLVHARNGTALVRPDGQCVCVFGSTDPQDDGGVRAFLFTAMTVFDRDEIRYVRHEILRALEAVDGDWAEIAVTNPHSARWAKVLGCTQEDNGKWYLTR